jgi:dTMP kinase
MRTGILISLEGIDGSGKSTMRDIMAEHLLSRGVPVIRTREPGGTPFAESIRELLLAPSDEPVNVVTETALFFAARKQHIEAVIKPYLKQGYVVLSDRFTDSTYSYQYSKDIAFEEIGAIEKATIGDFKPHHTFYYDIDRETSLLRHAARGRLMDRMEHEFYEKCDKTLEGYRRRMADDPERFVVIDARRSLDAVTAETIKQLDLLIG